MSLFRKIENLVARIISILVLLFIFVFSISTVSVSSVYEHGYRSFYSVDLKIGEEISLLTTQNLKTEMTPRQFSGVGYANFTSAARNAAKEVGRELPTQIHHFATNKNSVFTKQMSAIAEKYGLDLNGAWNKAAMPHLGRHPNDYHKFVLQGMEQAGREAGGNQAKFLQLFDQYVKQPVLQNPSLLRKSGW